MTLGIKWQVQILPHSTHTWWCHNPPRDGLYLLPSQPAVPLTRTLFSIGHETSAEHVSHLLMERDRNDRSISYRPETPSPSIRHNSSDKLRIKLNQSLERSISLRHCHIPALGKLHSSGHLEAGGSNGNWFVNLTTAAAPATTPSPPGMTQKGAHSQVIFCWDQSRSLS
ncbi:hypothetical protein KIL84_004936 [Mauremys mutica]|uniref:Uncharacterized protein n=1 Tax=Mauremys mutica TaxID=74926 RepID=A0A9D3XL25_9SAUR|nr:hypothetical protein KIL84_004936 [Mauremys mutica]